MDTTGTLCTEGGGGGGGGAVFGPTAVGSAAANPPILIGGTVDGTAAGAVSVLKVLSGTGFINCANCSGSGISVGFAGPIGSVGTPGGFKDGGGNFQPLLGDTSFGQWMNIKQSVALSVTGTFWQTTQPVSVASLPLPSGAATAGNQPTNAAQASTTSGQTGTLVQCAVTASTPSYTTAQTYPFSCDTAGNVRVNVTNTNANGAATAANSSPVTPSNQPIGAAAFAATQVSVTSGATSILAARTGVAGTGRVSATICNTTTTAIYIGGSGVTASTGSLLAGVIGACLTVNTTAALYGISGGSSATVTALETF
jgi:hypothetical protein